MPPHRALHLPGLHSYAQRSIAAGDTIEFRVSSTVPYRLSVCRLAGEVDEPTSDVVLHTLEEEQPSQQPIHPGSYVHVDQALEDLSGHWGICERLIVLRRDEMANPVHARIERTFRRQEGKAR